MPVKDLEAKINEIGEWLGPGSLNFFGRQFAGKDMQAGRLGKSWGVPVVSGGEILRNSDVPEHVKAAIDRGELAPTDEYKKIVIPYLSQADFAGKPLLLSAVGRMHGEEPGVIAATSEAGHPIRGVPHLEITEDEAFRRLKASPSRGRADDTPEVLRQRLDAFLEQTLPVLDTYDEMGLLLTVDAMPEEEVVFSGLVHALYERALEN
jgi:adenylate kinase